MTRGMALSRSGVGLLRQAVPSCKQYRSSVSARLLRNRRYSTVFAVAYRVNRSQAILQNARRFLNPSSATTEQHRNGMKPRHPRQTVPPHCVVCRRIVRATKRTNTVGADRVRFHQYRGRSGFPALVFCHSKISRSWPERNANPPAAPESSVQPVSQRHIEASTSEYPSRYPLGSMPTSGNGRKCWLD